MRTYKSFTKEEVEREYLNVDVSMTEACKKLNVSCTTFTKALKHLGLEAKGRSWNRNRTNKFPKLQDREWLADQLETKSMARIARELGTSVGNVADFTKRHGIKWKDYDRIEAVKAGLRKTYPRGRFGPESSNWKGGKILGGNKCKYIQIYQPDHPYSTKDGYVMEHRLVAEKHIGRYLEPSEIVHHMDGNGHNNDWENLLVTTKKQHFKDHFDAVKEAARLRAILDKHNLTY